MFIFFNYTICRADACSGGQDVSASEFGGPGIERVVNRSGHPGAYGYSFELIVFNPAGPQNNGDLTRFMLNGATATAPMRYYGEQFVAEVDGGPCSGGSPSPLFVYAAFQDHLNAWDGNVNGVNFHFDQKRFSDLHFQ
jgi:hypothetical protein